MKRYLPIFLLLPSLSAYGALNKWVDAEGKIHYSDELPPPDVKAQALVAPSAASGVPAQKTIAEREAERKKAQKTKEEAAQKAAQQTENELIKQKNCESAKANLRIFEGNSPIAAYNDKGERVDMDATARQQKIEEMRKQISLYCN